MSDPSKKSSNGTVDQIIEHIAADIQNSDGQYIQLGFTPPPTPNDTHIWSEYPQNQHPQNPFVHYGNRNPENLSYIDPNSRYVSQNVPYNNFIPQSPIFVSEIQNNFENMHGNKFVLYQGQNPQYVMTNQEISYNYLPVYPENRELYSNQEMQNSSDQIFIPQNHNEALKNKIMIQPTQNRTHLIENLVGNWTANTNGTYSPFGNVQNQNTSNFFERKPELHQQIQESDHENLKNLKSTVKKQKQIAEVKPMRPSYSDVLTKSAPLPKQEKVETKETKKQGQMKKKTDKFGKISLNRQTSTNDNKENKEKFSEKVSGDQKVNLSRKWVSLDDVNDVHSNSKDFLKSELNESQNSASKKKSKKENIKNESLNKNLKKSFHENSDLGCQWTEQEDSNENMKNEDKSINKNPNKKVKEPRSNSARQGRISDKFTEKPPNSAKRAQRIRKKDNTTNFGIFGRQVQHYISRWSKVIFNCLIWFFHLVSDIFTMSLHLGRDLGTFLMDKFLIYSKSLSHNTITLLKRVKILTKFASFIDKNLGNSRWAFWNKWGRQNDQHNRSTDEGKAWLNSGLEHNINMPTTGEEAMKRLLACKGKDPYSILGVRPECTDDDIKRYYKRQAFLVHPDKNPQPGAEEAFKILVHAFDIIGEPERRQSYDRKVAESHQVEQAWSELNDLLSQLHQKMEYAANTIRCTNCTKRHRRVAVDRPCYAARMCSQCKIHHSAKEGDIWAEATCWGFLWHYYACMDGAVYDITEWAGCQRKNLKHLRPNSHNVQYRIVLGKQAQQGAAHGQSPSQGPQHRRKNAGSSEREADLENFLNNLYSQTDINASTTNNSSQHSDTGNSAARNRKKNKRKK